MKELKFNKAPVIALLIMGAILLIVGIVFALLPEETYISWGDYESYITRYVVLFLCGLLAFVFLMSAWGTASTQKKIVERINAIMQSFGEDAIVLSGTIVDREGDRVNAKRTALSVLAGMLSAFFLGVGFFRIHRNDNARYFILHSEGMYILDMQDKSGFSIEKTKISDILIIEKANSLLVEFVPKYLTFTVNYRGLKDISSEELIAKFKEVFTNPMPYPFQTDNV